MLDIFHNSAFSVTSLTDAINNVKFVPGRIAELGLFSVTSVATTHIAIEERDGQLLLVKPSPRGGVGQTIDKQKRRLRNLSIPHFQIDDALMAEEVQGIRAWGSESQVEMLMTKLMERGQLHSQSLDATEEYARIGAIKGTVTYADSTTLNLFTEFGVTQETEIDFDLDNATPASGALRKKCASVARLMSKNLDGIPFQRIHAFCGDAFFDDLIAHTEVRATYLNWQAAAELRGGYLATPGSKIYGAFEFGGITWENYRGSVNGTDFINTDKCHLFPIGVPNLFRTYYAPADYIEAVNTLGQRLYMKQWRMPNDKGIHMEVQSNPLSICTRPKVLIPGRRT